MTNKLGVLRVGLVTLCTGVLLNCIDEGGLNQNERTPGSGENGVSVGVGEIAIDPTGRYLVSTDRSRLVYGELESGATRRLPALDGTTRLAFDHAGRSLFATRAGLYAHAQGELDGDTWSAELDLDLSAGKLVRLDVASGEALWSHQIALEGSWENSGFTTYPWLEVSRDDAWLVLTYADRVEIRSAQSGERIHATGTLPSRVVDVDLTPDQRRLVITLEHSWSDDDKPRTILQVRDLSSFESVEIAVPNCADELAITPDGLHALLAPTTCQPEPDVNKDPVSVIDLKTNTFVRNLPGFGPVALAPGGALAVAFMDAENLDRSLFDDKRQIPDGEVRFHLMLIDTATLRFETVELGDTLPRYALSPDGKLLLVDSPTLWDDGQVRILDVAQRALTTVKGPALRLDHYVMTRDSSTVYLLDRGLFRITLAERKASSEPLEFTPSHLNITPDDATLVLREDADTLHLYDPATGRVRVQMEL